MKKRILVVILIGTMINISAEEETEPPPPSLENAAFKSGCGIILLATGMAWIKEILRDSGHRYLPCKEIANAYYKELQEDAGDTLSEKELLLWSSVQGVSAVPRYFWREIIATGVTTIFTYFGMKALYKGLSEGSEYFKIHVKDELYEIIN